MIEGFIGLIQPPPKPWEPPKNAGEIVTNDGAIQTSQPGCALSHGIIWVTAEQAMRAAAYGWERTGTRAYDGELVQVER
jgi:hypothetical protein